jgi:hypothetical protein
MRRIIFMCFFFLLSLCQNNEKDVNRLLHLRFTATGDLSLIIEKYIPKMSLSFKTNILDPEKEPYSEASHIISFTKPSIIRIWINRLFFSTYNASGIAQNIMHERMHKLRLNDSSTWNESRHFTVLYEIGFS